MFSTQMIKILGKAVKAMIGSFLNSIWKTRVWARCKTAIRAFSVEVIGVTMTGGRYF